jgi:hypothetical protein
VCVRACAGVCACWQESDEEGAGEGSTTYVWHGTQLHGAQLHGIPHTPLSAVTPRRMQQLYHELYHVLCSSCTTSHVKAACWGPCVRSYLTDRLDGCLHLFTRRREAWEYRATLADETGLISCVCTHTL